MPGQDYLSKPGETLVSRGFWLKPGRERAYHGECTVGVFLNCLDKISVKIGLRLEPFNLLRREVLLLVHVELRQNPFGWAIHHHHGHDPGRHDPCGSANAVVELLDVYGHVSELGGPKGSSPGEGRRLHLGMLTWLDCWHQLNTRGPVPNHGNGLASQVHALGPSCRVY